LSASSSGTTTAGFRGTTGDCVTRAIAIATGLEYRTVYADLFALAKSWGLRKPSPRQGVPREVYDCYLKKMGWVWTATMLFGQGCTVHVRPDELPRDVPLVLRLSKHIACVRDGELRDIYDCAREGKRCVYGFYRKG
jgi:hypothetical protein